MLLVASFVPAPWGPIHIAATDRGIAAIDLLAPPEAFMSGLRRRFGIVPDTVTPEDARGNLAAGLVAVQAFLEGDGAALVDLQLDLVDRPAWDRAVLAAVRNVPWGRTASYGTIALAIGRRGAARAVGGAVGRNPISLAIPCHRVIAGDGTLGGYGGGWWGSRELRLDLKRDLLAREGTTVADSRTVAQATPPSIVPR